MARGAAGISGEGLKYGGPTFQNFGADFNVRFDGFTKARDGVYEAFFTFKNVIKKLLGLGTSTCDARVEETDGIGTSAIGNIYRANGEPAEQVTHGILVEPGGETHIRLRFHPKTSPEKLVLKENYGDTQLQWDVSKRE